MNGTREGLFLNYNHSGSANVICVNNERATRFEIHPKNISAGDDSRRSDIIHKIRWALGREIKRLNVHDIYLNGKAYKNTENEDYPATEHETIDEEHQLSKPTVISRRQKKKLVRALNLSFETTRKPKNKQQYKETNLISMPSATHSPKIKRIKKAIGLNSVNYRATPQSTLVFGDNLAEYVLVETPRNGIGTFAPIVDGIVTSTTFTANMSEINSEKFRAMIATVNNTQEVTKYEKIKGKQRQGRYHPEIGYVAPDEADPESILAGMFKEADLKEWNSIIDNCVLTKVDDSYKDQAIRTRFRRTYKEIIREDGSTYKQPKSRFLVCAYNDKRPVNTTTFVPSAQSRRIATTFGLFRGWTGATIDIKTAFLLVKLTSDTPIYVVLPKQLPTYITNLGFTANGVYRLNRALYGLKESPKLFNEYLADELKKLGWTKLFDGIFIKKQHKKEQLKEQQAQEEQITGILTAYVDDLMMMSKDPVKDLKKIAKKIKCSDLHVINSKKQRHVGFEIFGEPERIHFDMQGYIDGIEDFETEINDLGHAYARKQLAPSNLPFDPEFDPHKPESFHAHHIHLFQRVVGTICWLGVCHPAYAARHGMLASLTHKPSPMAFRIAKGVLNEIRSKRVDPTSIVRVNEPELRIWVDAAVLDHNGRRGFIVQLADKTWPLTEKANLIHWKSASDKLKHASSTAAEVNAV